MSPKRKSIEDLIRENPEAFDYPDCGDPLRETGVRVPEPLRKLVEERQSRRAAKRAGNRNIFRGK